MQTYEYEAVPYAAEPERRPVTTPVPVHGWTEQPYPAHPQYCFQGYTPNSASLPSDDSSEPPLTPQSQLPACPWGQRTMQGGWWGYAEGSSDDEQKQTPPMVPHQYHQPQVQPQQRKAEVVVVTPWYPQGVEKRRLSLAAEMADFLEFLRPTPHEVSVRSSIRRIFQEAAAAVWPESTVKEVGGHSYEAALPTSALDLVVECCGTDPEDHTLFRRVLADKGCSLSCDDTDDEVLYVHAYDVPVVAIFEPANTSVAGPRCRKVSSALKKIISRDAPHAPGLAKVVKTVLSQMKYTDAASGGLGPYPLLVLCIAACRLCPWPGDAGECLKTFFEVFSGFDFASFTVTPFEQPIVPRSVDHGSDAVSVVGPLPADQTNIAAACQKIVQIRSHFLYSSMALQKWDGTAAPGQKKGYKGRTPLALIIPLQPLWGRAEMLRGGEVPRSLPQWCPPPPPHAAPEHTHPAVPAHA